MPGQDQQDELAAYASSLNLPSAPVAQEISAAPEAPVDDLAAYAQSVGAPVVSDVSTEADPQLGDTQLGPEYEQESRSYSPVDIVKDNASQFGNFVTRLQAGLGANDTEKLGFLKQKFGEENARYTDGKLFFRKDKGGKFKRLDPDTLEIINDIIPDFAREITQELFMAPAEIAVGTAGALTPVPGAAPAGIVATRAALARPSIDFADAVAAKAGVPQDPTRDVGGEAVVQSAMEALAPAIGAGLKFVSKFIPKTQAYALRKAANEAEKGDFILSNESKDILRSVRELEKGGILAPIDGRGLGFPEANVVLGAHQLHPDNPLAQQAAKLVGQSAEFRNWQTAQGEAVNSAIKDNLAAIVQKSGKGPVSNKALADAVTDAATDLSKAEGKAIGAFKAKAMANTKNQLQPLPPETIKKFDDFAQQLGIEIEQRRIPGTPEIQKIYKKGKPAELGTLGITDPGQLNAFRNKMFEVLNKQQNNGMRISRIEEAVSIMGDLNQAAGKVGGTFKAQWGNLTGELRQFRRSAIKNGLPDEVEKKGFDEVMDSFSASRDAIQNIVDSVNTDMGANAVVKSVFNKGKTAIGDLRDMKAILGKSNPEVWDRLRGEFIDQLALKHTKSGPTGFNAAAFEKELNSYGDEFLGIVYDGAKSNVSDLRNLIKVAARIEKTNIPANGMSETAKEALVKDAAKAAFTSKYLKVNALLSVFGIAKGRKNVLLDILTKDGVDKYVQGLPKAQRDFASARMKEMVNAAQVNGIIPLSKTIARKAVIPTALRAPGLERKGEGTPGYYPPEE